MMSFGIVNQILLRRKINVERAMPRLSHISAEADTAGRWGAGADITSRGGRIRGEIE